MLQIILFNSGYSWDKKHNAYYNSKSHKTNMNYHVCVNVDDMKRYIYCRKGVLCWTDKVHKRCKHVMTIDNMIESYDAKMCRISNIILANSKHPLKKFLNNMIKPLTFHKL